MLPRIECQNICPRDKEIRVDNYIVRIIYRRFRGKLTNDWTVHYNGSYISFDMDMKFFKLNDKPISDKQGTKFINKLRKDKVFEKVAEKLSVEREDEEQAVNNAYKIWGIE